MITHNVVLYNMASSGLRHARTMRVRQWIPKNHNSFETLDELFDCAAATESKPEEKMPRHQQKQQQRHPNDSFKGSGKKREFRPFTLERVETPQAIP